MILPLLLLVAIIVGGFLAWWFFIRAKGAEEGARCSLHEDCAGYGLGQTQMACCKGICTRKEYGWCPGEGRAAGADLDQPCSIHEDCKGYGPSPGDVACCGGVCKKKLENNFCPFKKKGEACKVPTDCQEGLGCCRNICKPDCPPAKKGERCLLGTDCAEGLACKNNICTVVGAAAGQRCELPTDCQQGLVCCRDICKTSCPPAKKGEYCELETDCDTGMACKNNVCTVVGRPVGSKCAVGADCAGWTLSGAGVACCDGACLKRVKYNNKYDCPGFKKGAACTNDGQCEGDMACCKKKCTVLKKDYLGIPVCPHICKKDLFAAPGTC